MEGLSHRLITLLTACSALGCGVVAGVFFAFSTFVMPALVRLPPMQGIAAMQSINVTVINRWFLGVFLGTAVACAVLAVASLFSWGEGAARFRLGGCAVYLVGSIAVTVAFNVPRNDVLAAVAADGAESARVWQQYVSGWTAWNHVRAAASLAAAALLIAALLGSATPDPT